MASRVIWSPWTLAEDRGQGCVAALVGLPGEPQTAGALSRISRGPQGAPGQCWSINWLGKAAACRRTNLSSCATLALTRADTGWAMPQVILDLQEPCEVGIVHPAW